MAEHCLHGAAAIPVRRRRDAPRGEDGDLQTADRLKHLTSSPREDDPNVIGDTRVVLHRGEPSPFGRWRRVVVTLLRSLWTIQLAVLREHARCDIRRINDL